MKHTDSGEIGQIRLDLWFYYARLAKTRALCSHFITHGKVRLNGRAIHKPHTLLRIGDVLTFLPPAYMASKESSKVVVWRVLALGQRRGPAHEAALLYQLIESITENTEKT